MRMKKRILLLSCFVDVLLECKTIIYVICYCLLLSFSNNTEVVALHTINDNVNETIQWTEMIRIPTLTLRIPPHS